MSSLWRSSSYRERANRTPVLRLVVIVAIRGARDVQPQFAEFLAQGLRGDPEHAGGLALTAVRILEHAGQQDPVQLALRLRVQVLRFGP